MRKKEKDISPCLSVKTSVISVVGLRTRSPDASRNLTTKDTEVYTKDMEEGATLKGSIQDVVWAPQPACAGEGKNRIDRVIKLLNPVRASSVSG
ncbi:MAG: hypothetical protein IPM63_07940 [Acidobacteriota bacterium]|nr:MAG: hypothetical protein IPM63_07940 [Acidobacteriota bacterium]